MDAITIYAPGHYDIADSYGLIACELARHLAGEPPGPGLHVNALGMGRRDLESLPADIRAITQQPVVPTLGGIFLGYPTGYSQHANPLAHIGPRICVTMFESSKIPANWVEPLNGMDAVIVPSRFCRDTFVACGVTAPVHVVPLGVSEIYQYAERDTTRPLTFLAFLDRGLRKGGITALQAFVRAFGDDPNYRLILKMRKPKVALELENPNIEVIQRDMTEQELYELYLRCDVLINPNKGEGFGMIPREAAASGCLALATDWGGTADDIDDWGVPLPYTLEPADWKGHKSLQGQDLGHWASVDPVSVANRLQTIAANRGFYQKMAVSRAVNARKLYNWRTFAERVLEIWKGAVDGYGIGTAKTQIGFGPFGDRYHQPA